MIKETYANGVLRERWDDSTRTYTVWDQSGVLVPSTAEAPNPRTLNTQESALLDAARLVSTAESNRAAIEVALATELAEIQTEFLTPNNPTLSAAFNANPARYLKIIARILRRVIRLLIRRYDGTD